MAYTLKDQNGNFFNINGCRKGTLNHEYKYQGGLFTNNTGSTTTQRAFYSTYRRVLIDGVATTISSSSVYNSTAYNATSIGISGRYSNSSYTAYEVYLDGTLVASGDYTSTATTIYTYTKTTSTNIRIDGSYTDSKFVYEITTNPEIIKTDSYEWDNRPTATKTVSGISVGRATSYNIQVTQYFDRIVIPSRNSIKSYLSTTVSDDIKSITKISIQLNTLYWCRLGYYNGQYRPFLLNGSTTDSEIIYTGSATTYYNRSMMFENNATVDITSYMPSSDTSTKTIYGARSASSSTAPTTPNGMFGTTSSSSWHFCAINSTTTEPTFNISVEYDYYI